MMTRAGAGWGAKGGCLAARAVLGLGLALGAASCSLSQLIETINVLSTTQRVGSQRGLPYGPLARQKLDVYRPLHAEDRRRPVVVFYYGGFWVSGERAEYAFVGRALAEAGIVAVVPDYRLWPEGRYPGFVQDAAKALAWTEAHLQALGGDPERVFVMGHSAGAYLAGMVATNPRFAAEAGVSPAFVRGWIGLAGPYNFVPESLPFPRAQSEAMFQDPKGYAQTQVLTHASPEDPPALLLHGLPDTTVWPQHAVDLAERFRHHGVPVRHLQFPGVSHTEIVGAIARPLHWLNPSFAEVRRFIDAPGP